MVLLGLNLVDGKLHMFFLQLKFGLILKDGLLEIFVFVIVF
jgi:hypothetical protein